MAQLAKIEGIGPVCGEKMGAVGIKTTAALLAASASPKDRSDLADKTGFSTKQILNWANRADLMRVKGVGEEFSDLLEQAGVDTVRELATRNAQNLCAAMSSTNDTKRAVRRVPSLGEVERWIAHAKTLDTVLTY